jgi:hypothetical protein
MGGLADALAEAERELEIANDSLTVAELHVDQLKAYHATGTSYAAYPTDADLSNEFEKRNAVVRDAQARVARADGKLRDVRSQMRWQEDRQKAAVAARKLAAENEKKRQEELKKMPEQKPEKKPGPEFTPD